MNLLFTSPPPLRAGQRPAGRLLPPFTRAAGLAVLLLSWSSPGPIPACAAEAPAGGYKNDFTAATLDQVPDDMLVLDGGFAVKEEAGNRFLELPGAPLETYGVLFGPTEPSGLSVTARIQSSGKGRRFPTFGVGLNGVGGYKLQIAPAKKMLELYRGEDLLTNAPVSWESGSWTRLRLQTSKSKEGALQVRGRAWKDGDPEPKDWPILQVEAAEPPPGRPSLWGMPFAGTPIRFDDLGVGKAQ